MSSIDDILKQINHNMPQQENFSNTQNGLSQTSNALAGKMEEIERKRQENEVRNKALQNNLGYIDLRGVVIIPSVLSLISQEEALAGQMIPFDYVEHQHIKIALVDPEKETVVSVINSLQEKYQVEVRLYLISLPGFETVVKQYDKLPKIKPITKGISLSSEDIEKAAQNIEDLSKINEKLVHAPTSEILTIIFAGAIKGKASDIHIEAGEAQVNIRFRLDGVLHDFAQIDKEHLGHIMSRLKMMSNLKINVTDTPQDGHFVIQMIDDKVDVRISTLPTPLGESVVIRLLRSSAMGLEFTDLGLINQTLTILEKEIKRPNGMIIISGPTGAGKTTTLYAVLNRINRPEVKIITIEDPIEYELKGIIQSQVDPGKNYTFASGLKSIVRQDPDVIMVGEMRDNDTVETAINAALTGHLVFSTIHSNDAAGIIPRFFSLGAKAHLLAPALNAAVAQRLVRRLCDSCKKIDTAIEPELLEKAKVYLEKLPPDLRKDVDLSNLSFYTASGCPKCNGTGFNGRTGIFEIFTVDEQIQKIILSPDVSQYQIREILEQKGVILMAQDGVLKALQGQTSLAEVFRVVE